MELLVVKSLYFFLPAYVANMAPVLFKKLPWLDIPVSSRYFGNHKTWRGMVTASLMGLLVFWLQQVLYQQGFDELAFIVYTDFSIFLGLFLGLGAILGDLLKSYFKRKVGLEPGKSWFPWDQLDFVIGGIAFSCLLYVPAAEVVVVLFIVSPLLHIIINHLGYLLGMRKEKW